LISLLLPLGSILLLFASLVTYLCVQIDGWGWPYLVLVQWYYWFWVDYLWYDASLSCDPSWCMHATHLIFFVPRLWLWWSSNYLPDCLNSHINSCVCVVPALTCLPEEIRFYWWNFGITIPINCCCCKLLELIRTYLHKVSLGRFINKKLWSWFWPEISHFVNRIRCSYLFSEFQYCRYLEFLLCVLIVRFSHLVQW
jgi:hypothetical protein